MEKQESISQNYLNRLSVYMPYDDLIQKSTNTDVDPSLVHLQGVKGIQITDLTISLKTQKDPEAQYTSA